MQRIGLVFGLVLGLLAGAFGADSAFDAYAANMEMLQAKPVQAELGITERQRGRLNVHANWFNAEAQKIRQKYGEQPPADKVQQAAMELAQLRDGLKQRVFSELTANQLRRLRELTLREAGVVALLDERIATEVGITSDKLQSFRRKWEEIQRKVVEIQRGAFEPIQKKYETRINQGDRAAAEAFQKEAQAAERRIAPQLDRLQNEFIEFVARAMSEPEQEKLAELQGPPL